MFDISGGNTDICLLYAKLNDVRFVSWPTVRGMTERAFREKLRVNNPVRLPISEGSVVMKLDSQSPSSQPRKQTKSCSNNTETHAHTQTHIQERKRARTDLAPSKQ